MKKAIFWAAAALSLAACHTEDPLAEAEQQQPERPGAAVVLPIEADITLQDYAESRAAKQEWQAGDQLTLCERFGRLVGMLTREETGWTFTMDPEYVKYIIDPNSERSIEVSAFFAEQANLYDEALCGGFGTLQLGAAARVELTLRHLTSRIRVGGLTPGDSLAMTGFKLFFNYDYRNLECFAEAGSAIADEEGNAYFYFAPNRLPADSEGNPLRESDQFDSDPYRTMDIWLEHFNADRVLLGAYAHELSEADELAAGQAVAFEMPGDGNLRGWIPVSKEDRCIYYTTADNQPIELGSDYETYPCENGTGFELWLGEERSEGRKDVLGDLFFTLDDIFQGTNVTSVRLPKTIHTIGADAFNNCTQLQTVELPAGLKQIGGGAFCDCAQLQAIELPAGLTQIGEYAFYRCSNLQQQIKLPEGVSEINDCVFAGCSSLTNIVLPQGLKRIGNVVFEQCVSLTNIELPEGLTEIGNAAFYGCSGLTDLRLPQGVTKIDEEAFSQCSSLTNIDLPEGITTISAWMLRGTAIASLTIPESVTAIGEGAFEDCTKLASVTFPEGLEAIGFEAFSGCRLSAVDLPASIKNIGDKAFACRALKSVTCRAAVPPVLGGQDTFYASFTGPVYVPAASISAYENAEIWWYFTFEAIP